MRGSASPGSCPRRSSARPPRATRCSPAAASIPRRRCRTCRSPRSSASSWRAGPSSSRRIPSWRGCCRATWRARRWIASSGSCGCSTPCSPRSIRSRPRRPRCWCSRTCTGPIGRAGISWCSSCRGSPRSGSSCWPPTAPTTCTGATRCGRCCPSWCGCPPSSGWIWRRSARATRSTSSSGWPTAASPRSWCAAPPSAARATRSSPRSWCSASSGGLPVGLAEVLMARIEGLPPATQQVLRLAAVAGRRVEHDLLAAVSQLPDDELEQALRDAVAHHVLRGRRERCLRLPARAAARGDLHRAAARRAQQAARPLRQAASPSTAEESAAAELAYHAVAAHDLPLALAASVRAAREAERRAAPAEVLLHVERALELWDAVPEPEQVSGMTEIRLTTWAAWMASASGDPGSGHRAGPPRARSRRARATITRSRPRSPAATPCACWSSPAATRRPSSVSCRALELLADVPATPETAWAQAVHARVLCRLDLWDEARASAEHRPGDHRRAGSRQCRRHRRAGRCADQPGDVRRAGGRPRGARQRWAEAQPLARRAANLGVELRAQYSIGMSLLDEGRLAEASEAFAAGERRADETGITWSGYGLDLRVAHVITQFMLGNWDAAETAAEIAGESVSATVASRLAAAGLLTAVGRGKLEFAGRRATELRDSHPADEQVVMLLGQAGAEAALWRGDARHRRAARRRRTGPARRAVPPPAGRHHAGRRSASRRTPRSPRGIPPRGSGSWPPRRRSWHGPRRRRRRARRGRARSGRRAWRGCTGRAPSSPGSPARIRRPGAR